MSAWPSKRSSDWVAEWLMTTNVIAQDPMGQSGCEGCSARTKDNPMFLKPRIASSIILRIASRCSSFYVALLFSISAVAADHDAAPIKMDFSATPLPAGAICRFGKIAPAVRSPSAWGTFSADGKTLATGDGLWSAESGSKIVDTGGERLKRVALTTNGAEFLATVLVDGIEFEPLPRRTAVIPIAKAFLPSKARVVDWELSVMPGKKPNTVEAWNPILGKRIGTLESQAVRVGVEATGFNRVRVIVSPDRQLLAWYDGKLYLWDLPAAKVSTAGNWKYAASPALVFSPDSKRLALVTRDPDEIQVFDSSSGTRLFAADLNSGEPNPLAGSFAAFSFDGKSVFAKVPRNSAVDDSGARIQKYEVDSDERSEVSIHSPEELIKFACSPDGTCLQSPHEGSPCWFSPISFVKCHLAAAFDEFMAISPDGVLLAFCDGSRGISLREVASGREIGLFAVPGNKVGAPIFAPTGDRLATLLSDSSVVIWDLTFGARADTVQPYTPSRLWEELASNDSDVARKAIWRMAAQNDASVACLEGRLTAATVAPQEVHRLINDLDSDTFATRDRAFHELQRKGRAATPYVRAAVNKSTSAEVRDAAKRLLDAYRRPIDEPDVLRSIRAIEVLERIRSVRAFALLKRVATGAEGATQTERAAAALQRIALQEGAPRP